MRNLWLWDNMRITTGIYKGKILKIPNGIRPTQGKVRKAIFDILGDVEGLSFLELFAGSGAVGFEAISRGAKDLTLVESNRACQRGIHANMNALKIENCALYTQEAGLVVKKLHNIGKEFDIIFMDPPYYNDLAKKTLQSLSQYDIVAPNGFIIVQHFKNDSLPEAMGDLTLCKQSRYGDTKLSFYKKNEHVPESHLPGDI